MKKKRMIMKIQIWSYLYKNVTNPEKNMLNKKITFFYRSLKKGNVVYIIFFLKVKASIELSIAVPEILRDFLCTLKAGIFSLKKVFSPFIKKRICFFSLHSSGRRQGKIHLKAF
jgi:hypothetical protein